ncbi:MAG: hypothetical protein ACD_75C02409G0001, partial [uncultured bacterium]
MIYFLPVRQIDQLRPIPIRESQYGRPVQIGLSQTVAQVQGARPQGRHAHARNAGHIPHDA